MADVKISQLTALASANVVTSSDVLPIVDASVPQTKKITVENLLSPITIDKSAGTITSLGTIAGNVVINKASNPTYLQIGSSLADDPYMVFQSDGNTFAMGIDRSDSNRFKISDNATLGTNDRFEIDATGLNIFKYEGAENTIQIHSGIGTQTTGVSQIYFSSKDEHGGNTHQSYIKSTIDGSSSTSATKMTFHNRDSGGTVQEYLTIKADGKIGFGTNDPVGDLEITAGDEQVSNGVYLSNNRNANNNQFLYFRKRRASSVPSSGDTIGEIGFQVWDGDEYHTGARIESQVTGSISNNAPKANLIFKTQDGSDPNPTERVRIKGNGGLTFNGDTADANALDDYEEGTSTATFRASSVGTITIGTSLMEDKIAYTKIGQIVFFKARLKVTAVDNASGELEILNLPFTSANPSGDGAQVCTVYFENSNGDLANDLVGLIGDNSTKIIIRESGTGGTGTNLAANAQANSVLIVSGHYFTVAT